MAANNLRRRAIFAAFGYMAIMALGMAVSWHGFGYRYGQPVMMRVLIWFEIALSLYAFVAARRIFGDWRCGFGGVAWRGIGWMAPHFAAIAVMVAMLVQLWWPDDSGLLGLVVVTTLLVGFSEELMFRGIVLRGALTAGGPRRAVLTSAALFALLHGVNVLGGAPVLAVMAQVGLTFVFGFGLACIALRVNALWPLMLFHALWDMLLFMGTLFQVEFGIVVFLGIAANALVGVALWMLGLPRGVSSSAR